MQKIACFESAVIVAEFEQNDARKKYPSGSLCFNAVVGRRVCSRRPSHGVCGSFDDRRMVCAGHSTIVVSPLDRRRSSYRRKSHGMCLALRSMALEDSARRDTCIRRISIFTLHGWI